MPALTGYHSTVTGYGPQRGNQLLQGYVPTQQSADGTGSEKTPPGIQSLRRVDRYIWVVFKYFCSSSTSYKPIHFFPEEFIVLIL